MVAKKCSLCSRRCWLYVDQYGDWIYTKQCSFVSLLQFSGKTERWVHDGGNQQSLAIFSDILGRKKEEKVRYHDGSLTAKFDDKIELVPVPDLVKKMPEGGVNLRIMQINNLKRLYPKGEFGLDTCDLGLRHSLLVIESSASALITEAEALLAFDYLYKPDPKIHSYIITKNGFEAEMSKRISDSRRAFIALAFEGNESVLMTIRDAIQSCGYEPVDMVTHQHNNYIMDEIFERIRDSDFIVCDMSIPNYGAYLEAGFAMGLGKTIILTCSDQTFNGDNGLHFDLKQYKTEIWKDQDDLRKKLIERIDRTIG